MIMQPMETAPKDGTYILLYARWEIPLREAPQPNRNHEWRIAEWSGSDELVHETDAAWLAVKKDGYWEEAFDPKLWANLPDAEQLSNV